MMFECADRKGIDRRDALLSGGSLLVSSALMGEALAAATSKPANAQAALQRLPRFLPIRSVTSLQAPTSTPIRSS